MSFPANRPRFALVLAFALPAASVAQHQHGGHSALAAPARAASAPAEHDARAKSPLRGSYRSAFEGYRSFSDPPAVSWREANDTVGRIGGWRAYAREAHEPAAPERAASQPGARRDARGGHGAHEAP